MDGKLIGSNIARQSRYELIHTTLVKFLKTCTLSDLSPEQEEQAKEYLKEDSSKTVYRSDSDTLQRKFALFEPIREAFGFFKVISRKIFTSGADCYVSLNMTILVMLDSKCAPF